MTEDDLKQFQYALEQFKSAAGHLSAAWERVPENILGDTCRGIDCSFDEFAMLVMDWQIQPAQALFDPIEELIKAAVIVGRWTDREAAVVRGAINAMLARP